LFYFDWISSLKVKEREKVLLADRPWLTFRAIKWLNSYIKPWMRVFEYGSGGSTLFLAKRIESLVSIEHDEKWYQHVADILKKEYIINVSYILIKSMMIPGIGKNAIDPNEYGSGFKEEYQELDFSQYVKIIDNYPDDSFDVILIDGRSRPSCIKHAVKKIKKNGVIILDNANRERYNSAKIQYLSNFTSKCFFGIGPYNITPWETAVFIK
jgi:predicted O-methyltransferase YrrM